MPKVIFHWPLEVYGGVFLFGNRVFLGGNVLTAGGSSITQFVCLKKKQHRSDRVHRCGCVWAGLTAS